MKTIRLGTRGSQLALWQANWVKRELEKQGVSVELVPIITQGDHQQIGPIARLGAVGVFTREIQRALLHGEVDLAVHSLKDLPTEHIPSLVLAAVPLREDHRDVFISNQYTDLFELPQTAVVGTGSLRRRTQLLHLLPQAVNVLDIRGNVETRLTKLDKGEYDAIILAAAGLIRLGYTNRIRSYLAPPHFLPAPGQGALGLETRTDDTETLQAVRLLDDQATHLAVLAERSLLATLEGGCIAPIGTYANWVNETLTLHARVLSPDGTKMFERTETIPLTETTSQEHAFQAANMLGKQTAELLLAAGADSIIDLIKGIRR